MPRRGTSTFVIFVFQIIIAHTDVHCLVSGSVFSLYFEEIQGTRCNEQYCSTGSDNYTAVVFYRSVELQFNSMLLELGKSKFVAIVTSSWGIDVIALIVQRCVPIRDGN